MVSSLALPLALLFTLLPSSCPLPYHQDITNDYQYEEPETKSFLSDDYFDDSVQEVKQQSPSFTEQVKKALLASSRVKVVAPVVAPVVARATPAPLQQQQGQGQAGDGAAADNR